MRTEDLLDAIGHVDDELLERSEKVRIKKVIPWRAISTIAACLLLVFGLSTLLRSGIKMGSSDDAASAESAVMEDKQEEFTENTTDTDGAIDAGDDVGYGSSSLSGKIPTLSFVNANDEIYATRHVEAEYEETEMGTLAKIVDSYTLFNDTAEEVELYMTYPLTTAVIEGCDSCEETGEAIEFTITIPANDQKEITIQISEYVNDINLQINEETNLRIENLTSNL